MPSTVVAELVKDRLHTIAFDSSISNKQEVGGNNGESLVCVQDSEGYSMHNLCRKKDGHPK